MVSWAFLSRQVKQLGREHAADRVRWHHSAMAGSPQKRARRAAARGEPLNAPAHDAHTPARAPAPARAYQAATPPGPATRATVDQLGADQLADLAAALQPGVTVRVERTRPTWCAGWVEELDLEAAGLGELYEYLADEHGGLAYRVTALHHDGKPLYTAQLRVAGPPREHGTAINRRQWEANMRGEEVGPAVITPTAAPAAGLGGLAGLTEFLGLFLAEARESRNHVFESVKVVTDKSSDNVTALLAALSDQANKAREGNTLPAQIQELTAGMAAVEELKDTVASNIPKPADDAPLSATEDMVREAGRAFVRNVVESQVNTSGQQPRPTPQGSRGQPPPNANGSTPRGIPSAKRGSPRQPPN